MILREVDWAILDTLSDGKRNVAVNIALEKDTSPGYVNNRMAILLDYRLVDKVGPSENSGLYEITDRGRAALELRDEYDRGVEFERMIDDLAENYEE